MNNNINKEIYSGYSQNPKEVLNATFNSEGYDGTNFSTRPSMGTARRIFYTGGTPNASTTGTWAGGGFTNTSVANVEEFTGDTGALNLKTITDS